MSVLAPTFRSLLLLAGLWLALMCAGAVIQPVAVRAANDPAHFDANAAFARLTRVLEPEQPHPVDSDAQERLRSRLLNEIVALGLEPQLRDDFVCQPQPHIPTVDCARVRNIVFSVGPADGPAILAATHYDSVPVAPGASDAGIGIAVWLEAARVLAQQDQTRRVVFLISDGEEPALLGAQAFVNSDPLMQDVEAVVNLEARGTRGPAVFFETNRPNADAIDAFAAGARRPLANSIMSDVYRLLPNSTDVTVLRREGIDILNIALLDGVENYHTPQDALAAFDIRSLQHMGDTALGVTRAFATELDQGSDASLVFTDIASLGFIALPEWVGLAGLTLGVLIAAAHFWSFGAAGRWKALGIPIVALLLSILLALGAGTALSALRGGEYWFAHPEATRAWCALLALLGVALSLLLLGRVRSPHAQAAAVLWFGLLGLGGSLALSGLSILFLLPVVTYALGIVIALRWKSALPIASILAATVTLIVWAPILYLAELALGFAFPFATAGLTTLMLLPWVGAFVQVKGAASWRIEALVIGAGALVALVIASVLPASSPARPQPLNIIYFLDASAGEAQFLAGSALRPLPSALAAAMPFAPARVLPGDRVASWSAPAPYQDIAASDLEIVSDVASGASREVRARLRANGAYRVSVRIPRAAFASRVTLNGVVARLEDAATIGDYIGVVCHGRACDGAELTVTLDGEGEAGEWLVTGQYPGAQAAIAPLIRLRPATATPIQSGDGMITLRRASLQLTPATP